MATLQWFIIYQNRCAKHYSDLILILSAWLEDTPFIDPIIEVTAIWEVTLFLICIGH
jgi:hypothetical protein